MEVKNLITLNEGIIDGITGNNKEDIYITHNEGRLFKLDSHNRISKLVDLTSQGVNLADLDYSDKTNSFYIPTFRNNNLLIYTLLKK